MNPETIEVSVKYGSRYTFFLREIGMTEEQKIRSKNFGVADEETAQKEYDQNVSILQSLSVKKPIEAKIDDNGDEAKNDLADDFFAERTPRKERIAFFAVRGYFLRLLPEESF